MNGGVADGERPKCSKAPRREISMSIDTLKMIDELLELIQSASGRRDAMVNEVMHALVVFAHEVKDGIDTYSIPKRGRWGSPTARLIKFRFQDPYLALI